MRYCPNYGKKTLEYIGQGLYECKSCGGVFKIEGCVEVKVQDILREMASENPNVNGW